MTPQQQDISAGIGGCCHVFFTDKQTRGYVDLENTFMNNPTAAAAFIRHGSILLSAE